MSSNNNDKKRKSAVTEEAHNWTSDEEDNYEEVEMKDATKSTNQEVSSITMTNSTPPSHTKKSKSVSSDVNSWMEDNIKYVVVTGGVLSGLGKGIMSSSIGAILKSDGYRVTSIKIDPYINADAGTMSPFEHGEVFVLDDGGEADLDLGNYERLMDLSLSRDNNITTGKVYQRVIEKERRGDYLGKTVQVIPHVTDEIMEWVRRVAQIPTDGNKEKPEVCVIELGGTVGDIESMPFIESLRQFQFKVGKHNFCLVHLSLIPIVGGSQKTKPTQHSVKDLRALGLSPDIIACRCEVPLDESVREKLALHCHVAPDRVLSVHTVTNLFRVPALLERQGLLKFLKRKFRFPAQKLDLNNNNDNNNNNSPSIIRMSDNLSVWEDLADIEENCKQQINIAIVGKYTGFEDSYLSVIKALQYGAISAKRKLKIHWIEATNLEPIPDDSKNNEQLRTLYTESWRTVKSADGILVPGGFGERGVEGMIAAAGWARLSKIPYLGVCLGFQVAVIEFARTVLGWTDANSEEFNKSSEHCVLMYMPEVSKTQMGGTMRLGSREVRFEANSFLSKFYGGKSVVFERHRHRYEVNPKFKDQLEQKGLFFAGRDDTGERMEALELPSTIHPFYLGCQYHPEFKARPRKPSPPFEAFIFAASGLFEEKLKKLETEQKQKASSSSSSQK